MFSAALNPSADCQSLLDVSPPTRVGKSNVVSLGEPVEPASPYSFSSPANPKTSNWLGMSDPSSLVARIESALRAERDAVLKDMTARHNALLSELMDAETGIILFGSSSTGGRHHVANEAKSAAGFGDGSARCSAMVIAAATEEIAPEESPGTGRSNGAEAQVAPSACQEVSQEETEAAPSKAGSKSTHNLRLSGTRDVYEQERGKARGIGGRFCFELRWLILSDKFEALLAAVIFTNALTMAVEAQYNSFDTAHSLGWPSSHAPAADTWPGAEDVFTVLELFFGIVYTVEVVAKISVGPVRFIKSGWNWFDTFIVVIWLMGRFDIKVTKRNPVILRATRLVRIGRVVRLVKTIQVFNILHLLIQSLSGSMRVLIWSLLLVAVVMLAFGLAFNFLVEPHIVDKSLPESDRIDLYKRFGSFSRVFVTMLEMTLGNWVPPTRLLMENVNEIFGFVCMLYVVTVNFAMIQVVRSVFVHETFAVANNDADLMVMQQEKKVRKHAANMEMLFMEADDSGDGYLSIDEFEEVVQDPRVKAWLAAMELDVSDTRLVFELLDDGDQKLSATELAAGVRKLKGSARSIDMLSLQNLCRRIERQVCTLDGSMISSRATRVGAPKIGDGMGTKHTGSSLTTKNGYS